MMANSGRAPSRTPPFVLVGLMVLVCILAYNYWSLSSENKSLLSKVDKFEVENSDTMEKRVALEKALSSTREDMHVVEGNQAQLKKALQDKDNELNKIRGEYAKIQEEEKKLRDSLGKCDANAETQKKDIEELKVAKEQLEQTIKQEQEKPKTCDSEACIDAVQEMLKITSTLVGSQKMKKALADAQLDPVKLMNGLPDIPAPVQGKPQEAAR